MAHPQPYLPTKIFTKLNPFSLLLTLQNKENDGTNITS